MRTCPFETMNFNMSAVRRLLWFLLFFHGYTVAQNPSDYYTKKEEQVKKMAAEILKLDGARCDWAANCSSSTCSRHACTPFGKLNDPTKYNFTCQNQSEPNPYCPSSTGSCANSRQVNYAMSYVRMPTRESTYQIPDEMCSTICMTRNLTDIMKGLASEKDGNVDVDELFYFGSVDGVARFYPGEELNDQENDPKCYSYDPRTRPWYNGAISLQVHLIVLIDNSPFANSETNSRSTNSALDATKEIFKKLIYTLSFGDMLDVIAFDEINENLLTKDPVIVPDNIGSGKLQDGMKKLINLVDGIPKKFYSSVVPQGVGFVRAISIASQRKNYGLSLNMVILVFTNGRFALTDRQQVSAMLKRNFSKHFIYSFDDSSSLKALADESDGYYERIVHNFDNPLYQINSFFNFMALGRNASTNKPHWTKFYIDFEGRGNITTVSCQALSPEGHLVGVVGIDIIFKSEQGDLPPNAGYRPKLDYTPKVRRTNNNCTTCNGKKAICEESTEKTFIDLECCGTCKRESHERSVGKRVAAIGVPLVVVLAIIIAVAWWVRRRRKRRGIQKPSTTELGPYE